MIKRLDFPSDVLRYPGLAGGAGLQPEPKRTSNIPNITSSAGQTETERKRRVYLVPASASGFEPYACMK